MNDQIFEVNSIENLTSEHEESMEIDIESEFDLESEDLNLDQIIDSAVNWASSPSVSNPKTEIPILPSNESSQTPQVRLPGWKRNPTSHHSIPSDWKTRVKLGVNFEEI